MDEIINKRKLYELEHTTLDILVSEFIKDTGKTPSKATILDLMNWSHKRLIGTGFDVPPNK